MLQASMKNPRAIIFHMGKVLLLFCVNRILTFLILKWTFSVIKNIVWLLPLWLGVCFKFGSFNREEKNSKFIELQLCPKQDIKIFIWYSLLLYKLIVTFLQNIFNLCNEKYKIIFFVTWAEQIKRDGDAGMPGIEENDLAKAEDLPIGK